VPALVEPPAPALRPLDSESLRAQSSSFSRSFCDVSAISSSASESDMLLPVSDCMPKGSSVALNTSSKKAGGLELTLRMPMNFSSDGDLFRGVSINVFLMW